MQNEATMKIRFFWDSNLSRISHVMTWFYFKRKSVQIMVP